LRRVAEVEPGGEQEAAGEVVAEETEGAAAEAGLVPGDPAARAAAEGPAREEPEALGAEVRAPGGQAEGQVRGLQGDPDNRPEEDRKPENKCSSNSKSR
jgi:hypothetical protein